MQYTFLIINFHENTSAQFRSVCLGSWLWITKSYWRRFANAHLPTSFKLIFWWGSPNSCSLQGVFCVHLYLLISYENDRWWQRTNRIKIESYLFIAEDFKYKIKHLVVVEFQQFLWITFVVLSVFLPSEQCTCLGNQEALSFLFLIPGITSVESLLPITVSFLSIWKDREWWKHGSRPVA